MNEIICPVCNTSNPPGSVYCRSCGRQIGFATPNDSESIPLNAQLDQLRREIEAIVSRIDRLQSEFERQETQPEPVDQQEEPATPTPQAVSTDMPEVPPEPEFQIESEPATSAQADDAVAQKEPVPAEERPAEPVAATAPSTLRSGTPNVERRHGGIEPRPRNIEDTGELRLPVPDFSSIDWERVLGRNWLAIIGALALAVGIGFFLKLSFDNNWIGDTGRILLGVGAGVVLLGVGEYARNRAPIWSQAVTAGGAATLYMSIYAAYALYELIRPDAAFLTLGLVVALAVALAVRLNSRVIGMLGIVGAFIAPALLGPELPDTRLILPYIAVIDLGILGVSVVRNWRWFTLGGWIGSYAILTAAYMQNPDTAPIPFHLGLSVIFLIFVGATTLFHVIWKRIPGSLDMALVAINAGAYFGLSTIVLFDDYGEQWLAVLALAMFVLYGAIAFAAWRRPGAPPQVAMITLPISLIFLTVAIPLGLSGIWLTTAWAAQGAILIWSGFVLGRVPMRGFGLGVLTLASIHLLGFPPELDTDTFPAFLRQRFIVFAFVIAALYVATYLYRRYDGAVLTLEQHARPILLAVASALTLIALTLAAIYYYGFGAIPAQDWPERETPLALLQFTLTVIWAVYASVLLAVGLMRGMRLARLGGALLLGIAFAKLMLLDTFVILPVAETFVPVLNLKFMSFSVAAGLVAAIGYMYRNRIRSLVEREFTAFRVLFVAANVVVVWALMVEMVHFFVVRGERLDISQTETILLSITIIWAVYGAALLVAGLWKNLMLARYGGLGLLGFAVAKAVLFDTFSLFPDEETYRLVLNTHFGTSAVTVVAIVLSALALRRLGVSIPEREQQVFRWLPAVAGALALWSMSLEAIHFFAVREELLSVDQESGVHLTLTVLWAIYGIGVIVVGFLRDEPRIRLAGMALLAIPVIKLFVFDVFLLEQIYRVAAFVTLGVLLLGTGLAYQRYSAELRGFLMGERVEPD